MSQFRIVYAESNIREHVTHYFELLDVVGEARCGPDHGRNGLVKTGI